MKLFGRDLTGYAKQLVVLIGVLLIASGLCGIQYLAWQRVVGVVNPSIGNAEVTAFLLFGGAELIAIGLSTLWIVGILLAWVASWLYGRFAKPTKSKVQGPFDRNSHTSDDEPR